MGLTSRIATIACLLVCGTSVSAQQHSAAGGLVSPQPGSDLTIENRTGMPAWITLRHPDLGPDASLSKCVDAGASAHFVAEPRMRAVVSAESRSAPHCAGPASCKASTVWPGGEAMVSFSSNGKSCAIGASRKMLAKSGMFNWGRLNVDNASKTHALFVRVSGPPTASARDEEVACIRPGYSARFLVPPGEEENWKRGRYHRFIEAELRPVGANCTTKTLCRSALEAEWIVPGDRTVALRTTGEGRGLRCQLEVAR